MMDGRPANTFGKIYPFREAPSAALKAKWNREAIAAIKDFEEEQEAIVPKPPAADPGPVDGKGAPGKGKGVKPPAGEPPGGEPDDDEPEERVEKPRRYWAITGTDEIKAGDSLPKDAVVGGGHRGVFVFNGVRGDPGVCTNDKTRLKELQDLWSKACKLGDTAAERDDLDVRVLPMQFGKDDRRHRWLDDCEVLCEEVPSDDWPIQGNRSIGRAVRELSRANLTWLTHHDNWRTRSGVPAASRSVHEHSVLCRALHHFTTYDQVALPNLAGAESLNLRRGLIEHAHSVHPEAPDWSGADDFVGMPSSSTGCIIDPARINYVAATQSAKAKIMESNRKAKEEQAHYLRRGRGAPGDGGDGEAADDKAPKGAEKKK